METRYTLMFANGSVYTDEVGRRALLDALHTRAATVVVPMYAFGEGNSTAVTVEVARLITIVRHDCHQNPIVAKMLQPNDEIVVSMGDYMARRASAGARN